MFGSFFVCYPFTVFSQSECACVFNVTVVSVCFLFYSNSHLSCLHHVEFCFPCLVSQNMSSLVPQVLPLCPDSRVYKLSAFPSVPCCDLLRPLAVLCLLSISQFRFLVTSLVNVFGNSATKVHLSLVLPVSPAPMGSFLPYTEMTNTW